MQNRAFALHCMVTIARLVEYGTGRSMWSRWMEGEPTVREEAIDSIDAWLAIGHYIAWVLLISGLILDILCFKWRGLARCFFILDMLQIGLYRMIPVDVCSSHLYVVFLQPLASALFFACDVKMSLVTLLVTQLFGNLFLSNLWMEQA